MPSTPPAGSGTVRSASATQALPRGSTSASPSPRSSTQRPHRAAAHREALRAGVRRHAGDRAARRRGRRGARPASSSTTSPALEGEPAGGDEPAHPAADDDRAPAHAAACTSSTIRVEHVRDRCPGGTPWPRLSDVRRAPPRPLRRRRARARSSTGHGAASSAGSMLPCSGTASPSSARCLVERDAPVDRRSTSAPASRIAGSSSPVPTPKCTFGTSSPRSALERAARVRAAPRRGSRPRDSAPDPGVEQLRRARRRPDLRARGTRPGRRRSQFSERRPARPGRRASGCGRAAGPSTGRPPPGRTRA